MISTLFAAGSDLRGEITIPPAIVHTPDLVARGPDITLTSTTGRWHIAGFFPEGHRVYIVADEEVVNLWAVLVYFWPVVPTLVTVWIGWRILRSIVRTYRSRDAVGQPHCRRCGYRLTACTSSTCPECGTSLSRYLPRLAPPLRQAVVLRCLAMAAVLTGVIGLWTADLPRIGSVSTWFQWNNRSLYQPSDNIFAHSWWNQFTTTERVLLEYDATSGDQLASYRLGYIHLAGRNDLESLAEAQLLTFGRGHVDRSDNERYLGVDVYAPRQYVVFDCSTRRIVDSVATVRESNNDDRATIRSQYGLKYDYEKPTEFAVIDGVELQYSVTRKAVKMMGENYTRGEREGDRVLLVAGVLSHRADGWELPITQPVVGDLKTTHWFARLDISAVNSPFLRVDLNSKGDRVLAQPRDYPKKVLIFELSQELSRLPRP